MKLLIVTQVIDQRDPVLGFFHDWVATFSTKYETIEVVCLKEGEHSLPTNVHVYSLGKENGPVSKGVYAWRFMRYAWRLRAEYDSVLVHMNQEYILIAGWMWKVWGKKIYLWRNHYAGSIFTDIAAIFCTKIFCTSRYSYTAKFSKTVFMPVGIPLKIFNPGEDSVRKPNSLLFLARIAPSKHPDLLIEAVSLLVKKGIPVSASIYGDPLPEHEEYSKVLRERVAELGLSEILTFHPGIPNVDTPRVYRQYEFFINCSRSGMFDKTLFEAAACGCVVLAASKDFAQMVGDAYYFELTPESLAASIELALTRGYSGQEAKKFEDVVSTQSLSLLSEKLYHEIASKA